MINSNVKKILKELPERVNLVAAVKDRSSFQIKEAIEAGVEIVGENYLQQAKRNYKVIGRQVKWHFIGHLQTNKARKAVQIFDMIETLDSLKLAVVLDAECRRINKKMPVLIEINSAFEEKKYGVLPNDAFDFVAKIGKFSCLEPAGLMTMGPFCSQEEKVRPYLKNTKVLFDQIKNKYPDNLSWRYLSMGMSSTYKIALEEGANMVRVGTALFGPRRPLRP